MKRTLVVGVDSGIGQAIYNKIPGAEGTSRRDNTSFIYLDIMDDPGNWPKFQGFYDQVYYCIGVAGNTHTPTQRLEINAIRTHDFLNYLAPNIAPGGEIKVLTSIMGSSSFIKENPWLGINAYYKMSKAALNMGIVHLSNVHPNINWQLVHPGFVLTKMTKGIPGIEKIGISPETSAEAIISLPVPKGVSHVSYDGQTLGW